MICKFFCRTFPDSSVSKEFACNAGDPGSINGSGRSAREGIGYSLQYSGVSAGKESACNMGDLGSIPGRCPGEGKGDPLQYAGLENAMDCIVHRVSKSQARLSDFHFNKKIVVTLLTLILQPRCHQFWFSSSFLSEFTPYF